MGHLTHVLNNGTSSARLFDFNPELSNYSTLTTSEPFQDDKSYVSQASDNENYPTFIADISNMNSHHSSESDSQLDLKNAWI